MRCRDESVHIHERLAGTAPGGTTHWVLVEYAHPWAPKREVALAEHIPADVRAALLALPDAVPGCRLQLVRARTGVYDAPSRVWLVCAVPGAERLHRVDVADWRDLLAIDLAGILAGAVPWPSDPEPLFLVCTHGRRDPCCALYGHALYRELIEVAPGRALQSSHVGGHRFAACAVVLPAGVFYGRVEAREAGELVAAHARGEVYDVERLRGRAAWPPEAQAAEAAVRLATGDSSLDALRLLTATQDGPLAEVAFARGDARHVVHLEWRVTGAASASCGAGPEEVGGWVAVHLG